MEENNPIPEDQWTPKQRNLTKALATLLSDLDAQGQSQARIYHVTGDEDDPNLELAGILPHDPITDMRGGYAAGMRVGPDTFGLAISFMACRHLLFEEIQEQKPDLIERLKESLAEQGFNVASFVDEGEFREALSAYYYDHVVAHLPAANQMLEDMRVEGRHAVVVLKDRTYVAVGLDQGKRIVNVWPKEEIAVSGVPTAMYLFLHGLEPDSEVVDPLQSVEDYHTLQALEQL